jgi:hypothetical protein
MDQEGTGAGDAMDAARSETRRAEELWRRVEELANGAQRGIAGATPE